jgi:hypothetical protein
MSGKTCSRCGQGKPLGDFYTNANGTQGRMPYCKKCDNARPRKVTAIKVNRVRARHRAVADLIESHRDEFETLLAIRVGEAAEEAEALRATTEGRTHFRDEPVRLRPGKAMPGQKVEDRIDVGRCPHCIKHHDQGHVCARCGMAPIGALRLPDDGDLDEIAVERATHGDPVRLTASERIEVIRRMVKAGRSDAEIAGALHCAAATVLRQRHLHGIESQAAS